MIRCICISDEGRPKEIPENRWPKKDNEYHITFVAFCLPARIQGCSLYELFLDESNAPYEYYKLSRFGIHKEDLEAFIQLCLDCTDLNQLQIEDLVQESELQVM
jgi:hypothetical protein